MTHQEFCTWMIVLEQQQQKKTFYFRMILDLH